jgi:anionic cell wall polymer biosynthesis LytR-Cps2A-Psr (LCP) family protein
MKKTLIIIGLAIFLAFIIFQIIINKYYEKIYKPKNISQNLIKKIEEKKVFNILLLGYAGGTHQGTYLTDTMMLAHIDMANKKAVLISIPRDVWVKIPTKTKENFHSKINTVYQMGLFPEDYPNLDKKYIIKDHETALVSYVVSQITGLIPDYFVSVDFDGFKKAIDVLGGVEINIEFSFEDKKYPVTGLETDLCGKQESEFEELEKIATESPEIAYPCRYETLKFDAGLQKMDGETALKFSRSRYSSQNGGDFERAKRQQLLLEAVKNKIISIGFVPKIIPLLNELSSHIKTDISLEQMQKFLSKVKNANEYKIKRLVITDNDYLDMSRSDDGQYILIPKVGIDKWTNVKKWIKNTIDTF